MDIRNLIDRSESLRRKYRYYLSLGYSDKAACVLSTLSYGDERLAFLVRQFEEKDVIGSLYALLSESGEETPKQAVRRYWAERQPRPDFDDILFESQGISRRAFNSNRRSGSALRKARPATVADKALAASGSFEEYEMCALPSLSIRGSAFESELPSPPGPSPMEGQRRRLREYLSTDSYESVEEKSAKSVFTAPTSTFRMTTGSASMGIVLNQIRSGRRVKLDQVRIEEILNYFDYEAEIPSGAKFSIGTELLGKGENKKLLFIDVQAAEEKKERQNLVLLLDVSGSMSVNSEVTQETVATVVSKLRPGDRFSLITYSTRDRTVLDGYEIRDERDREVLMGILLGIEIDGCTYGSGGIETAYAIGEKYYQAERNNQVILITDGDLNFGITDKRGLQELIEEKKKTGLFLSVIGTGLLNYRDDRLEVLSKHGNGTYCVVNSLEDVEESIDRRFIALTNIVAKDVKAQVEFNPRFVKAYRLLGYENRELNHEDFRDDAVISEPYGSGGHGIALYELEMNTDGAETDTDAGLRYQTRVLKESDELGTVAVRGKEPLSEESFQIDATVYNTDHFTQNAQLAYFLYCLSEKLRGSGRLDAYDGQYLNVMLTSRLYRNFSGSNREKLETLVKAYEGRGSEDPADSRDEDLSW